MFQHQQDLRTFILVAQTESFTKAAAQLGVSRSAVSQSISNLERQLNTRLFHRSTRKVATTEVGEQLFQQIAPLFDNIDLKISEILSNQNQLRGTLRLTGTPHAIETTLWQKLSEFSRLNPDITLELSSDIKFVDIIKERFDAGIRTGDVLNNDVIAVKISDDNANLMCCVASPDYLVNHSHPLSPADLTQHQCVSVRLPTYGGVLNWEFTHPQDKSDISQAVNGRMIVNNSVSLVQAALDGLGIIWIERSQVEAELADGRLVSVLDDWAKTYPPYYLYYPNRHPSPLLRALIDHLKQN